jgi:peptide/nickel transport system permease protein
MSRSVAILISLLTLTIFAPFLASDPMTTDIEAQMQPPSREHLLGTDFLGRDNLSRILYGGQRTLFVSASATLVTMIPGILLGLLIGSLSGRKPQLFLAIANAFVAFPSLVLALVVLTLLGRGVLPLILAVGISQITPVLLITRSAVLTAYAEAHVEAAAALGATRWQVIRYHILPSIRGILLAYMGVVFAYSILNSTALSFLGLGGEPGVPDWGMMLAESRATFREMPLTALIPGIVITVTVMSINNLVDRVIGLDLPHSR